MLDFIVINEILRITKAKPSTLLYWFGGLLAFHNKKILPCEHLPFLGKYMSWEKSNDGSYSITYLYDNSAILYTPSFYKNLTHHQFWETTRSNPKLVARLMEQYATNYDLPKTSYIRWGLHTGYTYVNYRFRINLLGKAISKRRSSSK